MIPIIPFIIVGAGIGYFVKSCIADAEKEELQQKHKERRKILKKALRQLKQKQEIMRTRSRKQDDQIKALSLKIKKLESKIENFKVFENLAQ